MAIADFSQSACIAAHSHQGLSVSNRAHLIDARSAASCVLALLEGHARAAAGVDLTPMHWQTRHFLSLDGH